MNVRTPQRMRAHSNRVAPDRQDTLPTGQDILSMGRRAAGVEGFEVHVQIIENDGMVGRVDRRPPLLFLLAFF
ncbi:hypothetical protein CK230_24995 [Mesorhizobium sp. WSM3859]|nr:hypothetical protein CK230_24995 [Mesorhizobium sp. WSM3859]